MATIVTTVAFRKIMGDGNCEEHDKSRTVSIGFASKETLWLALSPQKNGLSVYHNVFLQNQSNITFFEATVQLKQNLQLF